MSFKKVLLIFALFFTLFFIIGCSESNTSTKGSSSDSTVQSQQSTDEPSKTEEVSQSDEAAQQAEETRQSEEAVQQAEAARQAEEAAQQVEAARQAEEAAQQAEVARQAQANQQQAGQSVYYANCTQAKNVGAAPLYSGQPGYSRKLDRDGDGIACEK